MDNSLFKKCDYYWFCFIFTIILSFGFYLTHHSMGIDDEIIEAFYMPYSMLSTDRIGRAIFKFLQIWDYIPFWREILAIFTLSIGITLHSYNFMKYINFNSFLFDKKMATIFSCLSISFPFLTYHLLFMLTCLENGINMILSAIAVYFFYKYQIIKKKKIYFLFTFFSLLCIVSVYEYGIFYFLASCFFIELLNLIFNEKYKTNLFYKNILSEIIILVPCIFIIRLISYILHTKMNFSYMRYEEWFRHDFSSFSNFVNSFISSTHEFIKNFIETCSYNFGSSLSIICLITFFFFVLITSIKRKQIHIFLCGLILIILPFSIFILTGNPNIYYRTYALLGFLNAFSFVLIYAYFKNTKLISKSIIFLAIISVFYQTLELNKIFYTEYLKYENDKLFAYSINHEISKLNKKPLLIVGTKENPKLKYEYYIEAPEINISIFNWDRYDNINEELFNIRPYAFMRKQGFWVEQYLVEINSDIEYKTYIDNIKKLIKNMTIFPKDGSIKDCEKFILIKIGPSLLEKQEEPS